jgi:DNA helicase-2/ATP-dependent DNA helicase PcrA
MAILVRASFQTREFEERFITLGIPYRVIGGPRFYEREEIRDAIAYLRVIAQPDDDLAFERIVNKPRRGIGDASLQTLQRLARARGMPLLAAAEMLVGTDELKPAARNAIRRVVEDFARWRAQAPRANHAELAATVLDESGYTRMWQEDKSPEAPGKLENLKELVAALEEYDDLQAFLEHVSLVMENAAGAPGDMASLMTLHAAKGLEFGAVFLPGWEEGLFPHPRSLDEKGEEGLEEERRLAHVGLTRARRRAYVSFAANRRIHGMWQSSVPSRFVAELPPERLEVKSEPGLWGDGPQFAQARGGESAASRPFSYGARRGPVIEGRFHAQPSSRAADGLQPGMRVFHQKFGYGRVVAAESGKLEVEFEHGGLKHVMETFVEKA